LEKTALQIRSAVKATDQKQMAAAAEEIRTSRSRFFNELAIQWNTMGKEADVICGRRAAFDWALDRFRTGVCHYFVVSLGYRVCISFFEHHLPL
jgi:hypothetical protein